MSKKVDSTEQANPTEVQTSTTDALFPEVKAGEPIKDEMGRPLEEAPPEKPEAKGEPEKKEAEVKEPEPEKTPSEYLSDLNIKVKSKVLGEDGEVTVDQLLRNYQKYQAADTHLRNISEQRKALERQKADIEAQQKREQFGHINFDEPLTDYEQKIQDLESQIQMMTPMMQKLAYKENLEGLNRKLKGEGHADFLDYVPKIEEFITSQPLEEQGQYDTIDFFENFYLKAKLSEKKSPPVPSAIPDGRPAPPKVEASTGSPSTANEDLVVKQRLFEEAVKTGSWQKYFDFTGISKF